MAMDWCQLGRSIGWREEGLVQRTAAALWLQLLRTTTLLQSVSWLLLVVACGC